MASGLENKKKMEDRVRRKTDARPDRDVSCRQTVASGEADPVANVTRIIQQILVVRRSTSGKKNLKKTSSAGPVYWQKKLNVP